MTPKAWRGVATAGFVLFIVSQSMHLAYSEVEISWRPSMVLIVDFAQAGNETITATWTNSFNNPTSAGLMLRPDQNSGSVESYAFTLTKKNATVQGLRMFAKSDYSPNLSLNDTMQVRYWGNSAWSQWHTMQACDNKFFESFGPTVTSDSKFAEEWKHDFSKYTSKIWMHEMEFNPCCDLANHYEHPSHEEPGLSRKVINAGELNNTGPYFPYIQYVQLRWDCEELPENFNFIRIVGQGMIPRKFHKLKTQYSPVEYVYDPSNGTLSSNCIFMSGNESLPFLLPGQSNSCKHYQGFRHSLKRCRS